MEECSEGFFLGVIFHLHRSLVMLVSVIIFIFRW